MPQRDDQASRPYSVVRDIRVINGEQVQEFLLIFDDSSNPPNKEDEPAKATVRIRLDKDSKHFIQYEVDMN